MTIAIIRDSFVAVEVGETNTPERERGRLRVQLLEDGRAVLTPWETVAGEILDLENGSFIVDAHDLWDALLEPRS